MSFYLLQRLFPRFDLSFLRLFLRFRLDLLRFPPFLFLSVRLLLLLRLCLRFFLNDLRLYPPVSGVGGRPASSSRRVPVGAGAAGAGAGAAGAGNAAGNAGASVGAGSAGGARPVAAKAVIACGNIALIS